ncbi:tetraspanin [Plakobranchus ocellatus]|uniref:Tetraspanin n=1 Tax=Plakobranchus ocellatus TaxID=259542 RepID=A0AAV4AUX3_9GAST|nr:tetraspanin [Plakobranchus ocellatus]
MADEDLPLDELFCKDEGSDRMSPEPSSPLLVKQQLSDCQVTDSGHCGDNSESTSNKALSDDDLSNRESLLASVCSDSDKNRQIETVSAGDKTTAQSPSELELPITPLETLTLPHPLHSEDTRDNGLNAINIEPLHTDLNTIICELQRIATDDADLVASADAFEDSAKCVKKDLSSDARLDSDRLEFLSDVMDDLTLMAESLELESDAAPKQTPNGSFIQEEAIVHCCNCDEKTESNAPFDSSLHNTEIAQTADKFSGRDHSQNLSDDDSVQVVRDRSPMDSSDRTNLTHSPSAESDDTSTNMKTATAARKRYASMKSKKVNNNQGAQSNDEKSLSEIQTFTTQNEQIEKDVGYEDCNQLKSMPAPPKEYMSLPLTPRQTKADSLNLSAGAKENNELPRPLSVFAGKGGSFDGSRQQSTTEVDLGGFAKMFASKFRKKEASETKQTDALLPNEKSTRDDEASTFVFVKNPHAVEVHAAHRTETAGNAVGGDNIDDDNVEDDDDKPLDMEQLLRKLDLSDKVKRQIRQASQLSFQIQSNNHERQGKGDVKRWKSLDNSTHNSTSPPSPSGETLNRIMLKPWKIPMAIKIMKNLRKKQSSVEEDRLSLEFFVPGRKTYIRLHRHTFFNFLLKYSIFFFTFIFWIGSLSCITYGTWMLTHNSVIIDNITDVFLDPNVLLCVVGAIIFVIAFIGCLGALRENICLLKMFQYSLTAVVVLEVLFSTLIFLFYTMPEFRRAVKVGPEEVLKSAVKGYFDDEVMKTWIDAVQKKFACCGVSMSDEGYLDWQENQYFNCSESNPSMHRCSVPLSCCIFEEGDFINYMCGAGIIKKEFTYVRTIINTKGCMKSFGEWLAKHDAVIGFVFLGLIGLQILGVVSGRYFIKNLRECDSNKRQSDRIQIGPSEE